MILHHPADAERLRARLSRREALFSDALFQEVRAHFGRVREHGDDQVRQLTKQYDGVDVAEIVLPGALVRRCVDSIPADLREAIGQAQRHVTEVNQLLLPPREWTREIRPGARVGERTLPLDTVCLWVPARKGPLLSTAIMLTVSAKVAGVRRIVVGLPPGAQGAADEATVAAAALCGADAVACCNGVGLIAGCTFGTASLPPANGIFGPGPGGIAAAMAIAYSYGVKTVVGIGPTDSVIYWDGRTSPAQMAYDFVNESEHGPDSATLLVTTHSSAAESLSREIERALQEAGVSRTDIVRATLSDRGMSTIVVCETEAQCLEIVNAFAPEHMLIRCADPSEAARVRDGVVNCGEILMGEYTPFSAANYAIGITAVLPTNGYSRSVSGITCREMMKTSTMGELTREGLAQVRKTISVLSRFEGLPFHGLASEKKLS